MWPRVVGRSWLGTPSTLYPSGGSLMYDSEAVRRRAWRCCPLLVKFDANFQAVREPLVGGEHGAARCASSFNASWFIPILLPAHVPY